MFSRIGYSITSSAGSLTPETVEGDEVDHDDGGMSVKSRSLMGTSVGIPDTTKIVHIMMAPIILPVGEKVGGFSLQWHAWLWGLVVKQQKC